MPDKVTLGPSAPVLLSTSIVRAAEFWRERGGFEVQAYGEPPHFAIASRGGARLMYQVVHPGTPIVPNWKVV